MKKLLVVLMLVMALLVVSACSGNTAADEPVVSSADASATDLSGTDISDTDAIPAPDGYTGYMLSNLYFCCPENYTAAVTSDTDAVTVTADSVTGANLSAVISEDLGIDAATVSKSDLDAIGENGAKASAAALGSDINVAYTYLSHGEALEGKGVYFEFDMTVDYTALGFSQTLSYYQLYISEGSKDYVLTFATNSSMGDSEPSVYFADVLESVELKAAE